MTDIVPFDEQAVRERQERRLDDVHGNESMLLWSCFAEAEADLTAALAEIARLRAERDAVAHDTVGLAPKETL